MTVTSPGRKKCANRKKMHCTAWKVLIKEHFFKKWGGCCLLIARHPETFVSPFALRMQVYFVDLESVKQFFTFLLIF
jgi:hypothetical protein